MRWEKARRTGAASSGVTGAAPESDAGELTSGANIAVLICYRHRTGRVQATKRALTMSGIGSGSILQICSTIGDKRAWRILVEVGQKSRHPGLEQIIETYYQFLIYAWKVMFDYQFVVNPAYNRDRGPASIAAIRLHSEF